jgi:NodT family efflux transporter outer membrane factor (OMF) lipoprotein
MHPSADRTEPRATRAAPHCGWRAIALPLLLALSACSVGPRYRRPDVPPPAAWQSGEGTTAAWPSSEWWDGFQSPELLQLIGAAEHANDDLRAALARVDEADAQARVAGAPLYPALQADGGAARMHQIVPGMGPNPITASQFTAGLSASYELDFWGKNRAAREAALQLAAASRFDQQTVRLSVLASVATTYFQTLEVRDRLQYARDNLKSAEGILKGLRTEQSIGTATALDVAQQATTVANLSASIPPLIEQLGQSKDALAILTGLNPEALLLGEGTLSTLAEPMIAPGLPSELLARRPDVAEAEAQLKSANANITVARAAFLPSIALTGSGGFASQALSTLFNPISRVYDISASLTQPIFQGGALSGQYQYSKARYRELLADYHKAVISAFGNVEDSLIALQQTADQLQKQQLAVASAQLAFDYAQKQFHAGTINILTLLNTQNALSTAEDLLVQVKYARLQALIGLFNALGGGWQQT